MKSIAPSPVAMISLAGIPVELSGQSMPSEMVWLVDVCLMFSVTLIPWWKTGEGVEIILRRTKLWREHVKTLMAQYVSRVLATS